MRHQRQSELDAVLPALQQAYFRPISTDGQTLWSVHFSEDSADYGGVEALRRSSEDFVRFATHRRHGGPWIAPLMKLRIERGHMNQGATPAVFLWRGALFLNDQAYSCLSALPELAGCELLAIDVVGGSRLWWLMPPECPEILHFEASGVTVFDGELLRVATPVLKRESLPDAPVICLAPCGRFPMVSARLIEALESAGLTGVSWTPVPLK